MRSALRWALQATTILCLVLESAAPQSPAEAAQQNDRAKVLMDQGKPEQAIPLYKRLAALFPSEPSFGINLVVALYKAGHYKDTIEQCESLLEQQPDLFPAWLFLGASQLKLGVLSAAEASLRKALVIRQDDPNARIMLADCLLATGHWAEAATQYELSAQAMPDNPRVLIGLDRSYQALAEESLKELRNSKPNSTEALALSAELELDHGQLASAFQHYRLALAQQPSFAGIHGQVAGIYEAANHPDWAVVERAKESGQKPCPNQSFECEFFAGDFREIAAAKTDSPQTSYWQARAFLALSQQAFQRLQQLPPSKEMYEAQAFSDESRGRYPEAAQAWKKALTFDPADSAVLRQLALALCHSNDCASALPLLKDQLTHQPTSAELNYLYGLALNSSRNPALALPYLENACRLDSAFLPARAALGEAELETGNPEKAIPHLQAAATEDENGSLHYQLARAYQAVGMRDLSVEAMRQYREIVRRRSAEPGTEASIAPP